MDFYSVFCPNQEFKVKNGKKSIGSIDVLFVTFLRNGDSFILGGKKWNVIKIDEKRRIVEVIPNLTNKSYIPNWHADV